MSRLTRSVHRAVAPAFCLLVPVAAHAACTVSSSGVAFGTYNAFSATSTDATGTVVLTCNAGSGPGPYSVGLSVGGGGTFTGRRMSSGSNLMTYQVYTDAARTIIWGEGSGGTSVVTGSDNRPQNGGSTSLTVYGRIPARLAVAPGAYNDILTMTIVY